MKLALGNTVVEETIDHFFVPLLLLSLEPASNHLRTLSFCIRASTHERLLKSLGSVIASYASKRPSFVNECVFTVVCLG